MTETTPASIGLNVILTQIGELKLSVTQLEDRVSRLTSDKDSYYRWWQEESKKVSALKAELAELRATHPNETTLMSNKDI